MTYDVGDLVAELLAAAGVTTAFGIVSIHNILILDAIGPVPAYGHHARKPAGAVA